GSGSASRPAVWSISPPVSTTAAIGLTRRPSRGCSAGMAAICSRKSGDALNRTKRLPSTVTARLAWVLRLTRASPSHASEHTGQRQFHWGKPPPAAAPSTMAVSRPIDGRVVRTSESDLGRQIAVDFQADADLDKGRGRPRHGHVPLELFALALVCQFLPTGSRQPAAYKS